MAWLESWAKAVVQASKTDQSERLDTAQSGSKRYGGVDDDASGGGDILEGGGIDSIPIQARRRAMKATVIDRYAFSTTAQLWAEEIAGVRGQRIGRG